MPTSQSELVLRSLEGPAPAERHAADFEVSWRRCLTVHSLDPDAPRTPRVLTDRELRERAVEYDDLLEIADAEMDVLFQQISTSGYTLLLADATGFVLRQKVPPELRERFAKASVCVGADWSEATEGTNGVGTCIAENRPVTVHYQDHFLRQHAQLTCTGAPIRDPFGRLTAVLDASNVHSHDSRSSQIHTRALVSLSANLIEKCLFLHRQKHSLIFRFHTRPEFVNLLHDGALSISEDGRVLAADEMAARMLGTRSREELTGKLVTEIFDIELADLYTASTHSKVLLPVSDRCLGHRYFMSLHAPPPPRRPAAPSVLPEPERAKGSGRTPPRTGKTALTLSQLAGTDTRMNRVAHCAQRIADSMVPVLIQGPTGSGKEAFARALHLASSRAGQNFVAVNCAAIPESLIESELFGYRGGAFTGARKEGMRGKIQQSSGGILFLDEIGDMPLALQTRLLRVLEEHEVLPLGSEMPVPVDLRVIAATHRDLSELITRGEFRDDLYYRLNGITLELSPLAEREDLEIIIQDVLNTEAGDRHPAAIDAEALECLKRYGWPGNVRELRNVLRTALALSDGGVVRALDLPRGVRWSASPAVDKHTPDLSPARPFLNPVEAAERDALRAAIAAACWNLSKAAEDLGISRNTLYRKLDKFGIRRRA